MPKKRIDLTKKESGSVSTTEGVAHSSKREIIAGQKYFSAPDEMLVAGEVVLDYSKLQDSESSEDTYHPVQTTKYPPRADESFTEHFIQNDDMTIDDDYDD